MADFLPSYDYLDLAAAINKQFKAEKLGPSGSRKLLTRRLISLRAFCPMINVLGTLGYMPAEVLKSLKKKVFFLGH